MKPLRALLLLLYMAFAGTAALAADADTAADTTPGEDNDASAGNAAENPPADIDAALADEIRAAEAAQAASPAAPAEETFVPSVQISEDLSVSFPVDI